MAEEICDDDDFDEDTEIHDDYEDIEIKPPVFKDSAAARRRLEQLREEKALERLLKGDFDDWN